ncbi:adenylate/guanylate cyclase domain-containing protein [Lutimonas halocynthiae]|uniref:adenylate/guanylate cyclase domain-containing protein n=1 Tax=Lutimonas halocynthiae TaxID=1446477 RepID=UPI0025B5A6FB|nr:adenylate/guanylate cyclase domain-containing protein [Lutimonas halocynthiae]MDN3642873.1 adenylate/guanylate cyclase domain-containing protein [Lutimonas halocynthiae]
MANREIDNQKVVLKKSILHNENFPNTSKFGHEYDILKDLDHDGIPKVHEIVFRGKNIALVQEFIEGTDLKESIFKKNIFIDDVLDISIQLADILHYIHEKGVIHKDINPSNIMLTKDGKVKLIDFEISSNLHSESNDMLNVDQIEGTLNYISPEQTGRTAYLVKHQCDFYSLGILLYELVAGKPPFDSIDSLEIIHFHLSRIPTSLNTILSDLPDGLEEVISKLMEKNPEDRYQSAKGLKHDLELIRQHVKAKKSLIDFSPGAKDSSGEYKQSQKLYGRENEKKELLNYYDNLTILQSALVLVAGYSGVGKSALIRHVKFPIIQKGGTFLSGKFDQFKQDIPYYAFIEGIEEFIKNLLSEPDEVIEIWKNKIELLLGDNIGLIAEVIPLISKIIKKYPEVPMLQPAEQESRFNMVLLDFITAFSTEEKPLVIFLDDLQWADLSSLNLVKRIIEKPRKNNILILGAYRDNEVEKGHPLLITLKQIDDANKKVKTIHLKPLDENITCLITSDSFAMPKDQASILGEKVFLKTKGNPFFIHSFLRSLFDKGLIWKDKNEDWVFDLNQIENLSYTENVIDLLTEGLIVLPYATQEVLKYGAVLGNTFKLKELIQVTGKSPASIYDSLKTAIKEGHINALDKKYRSLAFSGINQNADIDYNLADFSAQFTFTHDKVQQAAYNLIEDSKLAPMHLHIGRLMLKNKSENELQEGVFELLNHFALSLDLVENHEEKEKIANICLIAGKKAKESISYDLAVRFLEMGKTLLGPNSWPSNYDLTYNILKELGECEYLNHNPDKAEEYLKLVLNNAKTNYDKLKVYSVHTSLYLKIGNSQESLRLALEAAKLYGIRFPKNKILIQTGALLNLMKYIILFSTKYKKPEDFARIKESTDEENIALGKLMIDLASSAYTTNQNLMMMVVLRIIKISLQKGLTDASGWGFSGLSTVVLSALKLQNKGLSLWKLTIELNKKTKSPIIKWRLNYLVTCFGNTWRKPYRDDFQNILDTIKACVLNGDQIFTGYSVSVYQRFQFIAGINLNILIKDSEEHISLIEKGLGGFDFFQCFHQMAKGLTGQTNNNTWNDEHFNGEKELKRIEEEGNYTKLGFFHTARLTSLYYFEKYDEAVQENELVLKYKDNFVGELCEVLHAFYTSLSISATYSGMDSKDKKKYLKVFKTFLKDLKLWSKGCPENHLQHYQLIQAEYFFIQDDFENAILSYEKSIKTASENKFKYVEAIANERAAFLCHSKQLTKQSMTYQSEAWDAYYEWGCSIKCDQLINDYPEMGKLKSKQKNIKDFSLSSVTSTSSRSALDLASVIKASQSIASQVKYSDLLKKLLQITIENAGAERGVLLHQKGDKLCIEAEGVSGNQEIKILPSIPFDQSDLVPHTFINYSRHSDESEVVNDASIEERFNNDPFVIKNQTISMMCVPLTSQGKTNGLLYLENNLLKGVFNRNRINLLQMLSGQIGISIDNALLYENLEEKVVERTKEIEKQKLEIEEQKEKSDSLLLNILPKHAAEELKSTGSYKAQSYDNVSVMFCDIVSFTKLGESMDADMLVNELHEFFSGIDDIILKYKIEKIKTIGDSYLCASGLDEGENNESTINMINASNEILKFLKALNQTKEKENRPNFIVRIGIHTGPVTAGVVGKSKYAYDIWGDTVNTASRMESSGTPGKINVSGDTYQIIKDDFDCEYRGKIKAKNKGEIDMFYVNSLKV